MSPDNEFRESEKTVKGEIVMSTTLRRIRIDQLTPAETAIRNAIIAVERVGADALLTDAVILLQQARDKVADYVDRVNTPERETETTTPE